jgi:hypothetical protein
MTAEGRHIAFLAIANIPVYLMLGKVFFGSWSGLLESMRTGAVSSVDDFRRPFRFGIAKNPFQQAKLVVFLFLCLCVVRYEYVWFFE